MEKADGVKDDSSNCQSPESKKRAGVQDKRESGIEMIGDVPWGTHFCQFYSTKEDLLDILVPYFKAGLENNEYCMWVTAEPLNVKDARSAMQKAVPNYADYERKGQIDIIPYDQWYTLGGKFDSPRVLSGWVRKLKAAKDKGFAGLRLTGNTFWLEKEDWKVFADYEADVNNVIGNYEMMALCTYSLEKCNASEILDVVVNHQFALIKRDGKWEIIEGSEHKKVEGALQSSEEKFASLYSAMTEGVALHDIVCDETGKAVDYVITDVNPAFEKYTGLKKENSKGKKASELYGTGEAPYLEVYAKVAESGQPSSFEIFFPPMEKHFSISVFSPGKGKFATVFKDTTESKNAEEALRVSESKFRAVASNTPDHILMQDKDLRYTFVANPQMGLTEKDMLGKTDYDFLAKEDAQKLTKIKKGVMETGKPVRIETSLASKGGEIEYFDGSYIPKHDSNGDVDGLIGYFRNVTESKLFEKKIDHLASFPKMNPNPVIEADSLGKIIYANTAAENISSALGLKGGVGAFLPQDLKGVIRSLKESSDGKSMRLETSLGGRIFGETLSLSDKPDAIRIYAYDITERKQAENALEASEKRFSTTLSSIGDGVIATDMDESLTFMNRMAESLTGWGEGTAVGRSIRDVFRIVNEKTGEPGQDIVKEVLKKKAVVELANHTSLLAKDGRIIPIEDSAAPILDASGNVTGVVLVFHDVEEKRRAQEQLKNTLQRFYNSFSSMYGSILLVSDEGRAELANQAFCDMFDLKKHPEELAGMSSNEVIQKVKVSYLDPGGEEKRIKEIVASGKPVRGEEIQMTKGRTCLRDYIPIYVGGKSYGRLWHHIDITERKKAETELFRAQDRTAAILNGIADTFYSLDLEWRFTVVNPAAEKAPFGKPASALLGKVIWDLYPNLAGTPIQKHYFDAAENQSMEHYESRSPLNGRWYEVFMQGQKAGVDVYMRDVTERKKAEEGIVRSNQRINEILSSIQDDFYVLDRDWKFVYASERFTSRISKKPADFAGKNIWELFPKHLGTDFEKNFKAAMDKREIRRFEIGGKYTDACYSMSVFPSAEGITVLGTDVTQQKKAQEALRQSEERSQRNAAELEAIFASQADSVIVYDTRQVAIKANEAARKLLGFDPADRRLADNMKASGTGGDTKKSATYRALQGETVEDVEFDYLDPSGRKKTVIASSSPIRDPKGEIIGAVTVSRDITDRKNIQEALRESEERYRDLVENANSIIVKVDTAGNFTYFNEYAQKFFGYSKEEIIGKNVIGTIALKTESTGRDLEEAFDNIYQDPDKAVLHINENVKRSGERVWVAWTNKAIFDKEGKRAGHLSVGTDITEQRKAEEALRESEERFRAAFEDSAVGMSLTSPEGKLIQINPAFCRMLGYPESGLKGRPYAEITYPEDLKKNLEGVKEVLEGRKNAFRMEKRYIRKDGSLLWVDMSTSAIRDPEGRALYLVTHIQDITVRKNAVEALACERENLKKIFEAVNVGMLRVDSEGKIRQVNETVLKWVRKEASECNGLQPGEVLGCVHALTGPKGCGKTEHCGSCPIRNAFESTLRNGKPVHGVETEALLKLGGKETRVWLDVSSDPLILEGKNQAVIALSDISERKKKEAELNKLNRTLKALSDSNQAMMRAEGEKEYLNDVCKIIVEDCGHEMVWVGFAENDEGKTVRPVAHAGFEEGYLESLKITWEDNKLGKGPTGTAIRTGKAVRCANMQTDPKFAPWRKEALKRGYASSIAIPLIEAGRPFGAVMIYSKEPDPFTSDEVQLLTELAGDLSYGISSLMLRQAHAKAEESIREARDYLDSLINYANAPIIVWDPSYRITKFNQAFERLTGISSTEAVGKPLYILFPEDSRINSLEHIKRAISGSRWETVEIPILHLNGSVRTVLWNSANVHDRDGRVIATIAQGQDITERKRAEEALRESEEKYRNLVKYAPAAIYEMDLPGKKFLSVNEVMCDILGYSREELLSINPTDLMDAKSRVSFQERIRKKLAGEKIDETVEYRIRRKDGKWIYTVINVGAFTFKDEMPSRVVVIGYDITDRRAAEEALKESEEKYRMLVENANSIILKIDNKGDITFFNEYAEKFFGYDMEEVLGKNLVGTIVPEKESTGRDLRGMIDEILKHPKRYLQNENENMRKDKTRVWISWNNKMLYGENGNPAGLLSIGTDITARRKMEKELRRSEEGLRASVKEKDALIKEVHHRVKNNMQVISSLMKLQSRSITDEKAKDIFRQSQDRIKSIALIHEKLYQSKDLVHIDIQKYIEELAINLFRSYDADRKRIELSVSVGNVPIDVDMMIYCGLLINELVSNSLKYAFPGNMAAGKVFISMDCEGDEVSLIVGDDGVGLPKGMDIKDSGTLGMRLVSDLAERQLRGRVEIDRSKGTVFKISFKTNT